VRALIEAAIEVAAQLTVPAIVLVEWWRAGSGQAAILKHLDVEPTTERMSKAAGEALRTVQGASPVDAVVMASAALRGDLVYTSDLSDLQALRAHFPEVISVSRTSS
jgi:hypothetical protein